MFALVSCSGNQGRRGGGQGLIGGNDYIMHGMLIMIMPPYVGHYTYIHTYIHTYDAS